MHRPYEITGTLGAGGMGEVLPESLAADPEFRSILRRSGPIFTRQPDNRVMAVAVTLPAEGTNVQPGVPVPLFTLPAGSDWDVTPDGQRFLLNVPTDDAVVPPITVVLNWKPGSHREK